MMAYRILDNLNTIRNTINNGRTSMYYVIMVNYYVSIKSSLQAESLLLSKESEGKRFMFMHKNITAATIRLTECFLCLFNKLYKDSYYKKCYQQKDEEAIQTRIIKNIVNFFTALVCH